MKSFGNHINPEKDEQLRLVKSEVENKVMKILKLAKGINGNKDGNLKKMSEITNLIEDFHQHYEALFYLYEDLRGEVKSSVDGGSSTPPSDSESYYSPVESITKRSLSNTSLSDDTSDVEDTILKDKLTSSIEVKESRCARLGQVKELEAEVARLQAEIESLKQEQGECKSNEAGELRLEARVLELEAMCKDKEDLQLEMKALSVEKSKLEEQVCLVTERLDSLQKELEVKKRSREDVEISLEKQMMKVNEEGKRLQVENQELHQKISQLQTSLSEKENKLKASQNQVSGLVKNLEDLHKELERCIAEIEDEKHKHLVSKSKMERKNSELTEKIADQQKTLLELGEAISKLKSEKEKAEAQAKFLDSKSNFNLLERKIDEMAEELRKQFEDKYRILSRRIRVAEQLHVENKECYRKAREAYEEEKKELEEKIRCNEEGMRNIKEISVTANEMLIALDSVALKFEECNHNFLNRISKASCELKFTQDWVRRKNKALVQVKCDLDELLAQLDEKEAEILAFREKVWKSENKSRELEKLIKKKEDAMLVLQEEKREAIRQLCVWIDYHRSRSDYYMKILSDMKASRRKVS